MAKIIGLPKLSPTMEEGTLVRWLKSEGDALEVDDLVAEVETDKATMEFRSFDRGVLLKQLVPEGTTLSPDQPVAIIGNKGDAIDELLSQVGGSSGEAAASKPSSRPAREAASAASPAAPAESASAPSVGHGERVLASPVVRKLARERSIDLRGVRGSGPRGRVIKRDIDQLGGQPAAVPASPPPAFASAPPVKAAVRAVEGQRVERLSQMRKAIARRLTESKREVPHFYLTIDVDAAPLLSLRAELNGERPEGAQKVSLNDLIIKAAAIALRRMPQVNVSYAGDSIVYHEGVHVSVAVAIPDGLLTPVVRNADRLGVLEISETVRALAARAKEKKLAPEEMQGGTFSISNLGMFGIDEFSAVINPPEGAILAVSAVRDEPVVKDGAVVAGKRMALTLSCDHRVIDGALGAAWLKLLRGLLEAPLRMLL